MNEKGPNDLVSFQIPRWAHRLLKEVSGKGMANPRLALCAAVKAFAALEGKDKIKWLSEAQAQGFDVSAGSTH